MSSTTATESPVQVHVGIIHQVRDGCEAEFESGIGEFFGTSAQQPSVCGAHLIRPIAGTGSRWTVTRNLGLAVIYAHLAPQTFVRETGPAEHIDFLELTARFRF